MTSLEPAEIISDYRRFDFAALWKGRERVSEVERAILLMSLAPHERRRLIEIGTGFGRLVGALRSVAEEVVATDFDLGALEQLPEATVRRTSLRVAANLYHLPFVPGAFTLGAMVRVYHHLANPAAALTEAGRVLRGGGRLVVSYTPRPSVGTIVNDVQRAIRPSARGGFRSATLGSGVVALDPDPFPIYVGRRRDFARAAQVGGFEPESEVGAGFEEYSLARALRAAGLVRLGAALGRAPGFPTRFALLRRTGSSDTSLPELQDLLACPRCRTPRPDWGRGGELACAACGFMGRRSLGVLDLRYLPDGSRRWEAKA